MNKHFSKLLILGIAGLFLSGCSLVPTAWKSTRSGGEVEPTPAAAPAPTETLEKIDESVSIDLQTELDTDFKSIDADLKQLDEDLKGY